MIGCEIASIPVYARSTKRPQSDAVPKLDVVHPFKLRMIIQTLDPVARRLTRRATTTLRF